MANKITFSIGTCGFGKTYDMKLRIRELMKIETNDVFIIGEDNEYDEFIDFSNSHVCNIKINILSFDLCKDKIEREVIDFLDMMKSSKIKKKILYIDAPILFEECYRFFEIIEDIHDVRIEICLRNVDRFLLSYIYNLDIFYNQEFRFRIFRIYDICSIKFLISELQKIGIIGVRDSDLPLKKVPFFEIGEFIVIK